MTPFLLSNRKLQAILSRVDLESLAFSYLHYNAAAKRFARSGRERRGAAL